jgi:hypothetical protein
MRSNDIDPTLLAVQLADAERQAQLKAERQASNTRLRRAIAPLRFAR